MDPKSPPELWAPALAEVSNLEDELNLAVQKFLAGEDEDLEEDMRHCMGI